MLYSEDVFTCVYHWRVYSYMIDTVHMSTCQDVYDKFDLVIKSSSWLVGTAAFPTLITMTSWHGNAFRNTGPFIGGIHQ